MRLEDVLKAKGSAVITVGAASPVSTAVALMSDNNIGALVVVDGARAVEGILSERDVIRGLAVRGPGVLQLKVAELMSADVLTKAPGDPIDETARLMTTERIRHVPVVADGDLRGIVSIDDIVKYRISQAAEGKNNLLGFLHG